MRNGNLKGLSSNELSFDSQLAKRALDEVTKRTAGTARYEQVFTNREADPLVIERKAAVTAAQEAVQLANANAARARAAHNIIDTEPDGRDGVLSRKDDPNVAKYIELKEACFKARAVLETAEKALTEALPVETLEAEVTAARQGIARAFAELAKILQTGDLTDPNPDDPRSQIEVHNGGDKIANAYLIHKAQYGMQKTRLANAGKALAGRRT